MSRALQIRGLIKRYRRWGQAPVCAVDSVDLDVDAGEVVGLVGESGSGKTSLARAALGLVGLDAGAVQIFNRPLQEHLRQDPQGLRRQAQMVFQNPDAHCNPGLRVGEILAGSARLHRPGSLAAPLVDALLARVGLAGRQRAWPHELSGGERRRVGLASVLIAAPALIVADEPTSGLDPALQVEILDLLLDRGGARPAVLLVSHDLALVAGVARRLYVMRHGRVIEIFPAETLVRGPHHPYTWALVTASDLCTDRPLDLPPPSPALPLAPVGTDHWIAGPAAP